MLFFATHPPAEIVTSLRTAWAFGWNAVHLIDPHGAWFTADRATRAIARGAALRHVNPIRLLGAPDRVRSAAVITTGKGAPINHIRFDSDLVILPGESDGPIDLDSVSKLARRITPISLGLPIEPYRTPASFRSKPYNNPDN